jgi:mono/diheme cytochrome c family protein
MRIIMIFLGLMLIGSMVRAQGPEELLKQGQQVFEESCAACHRLNGAGLPGTFPALNGNPFVVGNPKPVIATILNGRKGHLGQMPTWKDKLDNQQIAAVATFIRHAWSNRAPAVTPATVAGLRGK